MKKGILFLFLISALQFLSKAEFYVVSVVGNTFSPATVTMNVGDTIVWVLPAGHTLTQVSQTTWNNNDTTRLGGGFHVEGPDTVGLVAPNAPGTYYYICQLHVAMGMKGRFIINTPTGVPRTFSENAIKTYPTIVRDILQIEAPQISSLSLEIYNLKGELVHRKENISQADVISLGHLTKGMYVGVLSDNERRHTWKFLKD